MRVLYGGERRKDIRTDTDVDSCARFTNKTKIASRSSSDIHTQKNTFSRVKEGSGYFFLLFIHSSPSRFNETHDAILRTFSAVSSATTIFVDSPSPLEADLPPAPSGEAAAAAAADDDDGAAS